MCLEPATVAASMAIDRPEAIDDALSLLSRSRAEDGGRAAFLFREEWTSGVPASPSPRGGRPGEESCPAAIAAEAIEAKPTFGEIKPMRGRDGRGP